VPFSDRGLCPRKTSFCGASSRPGAPKNGGAFPCSSQAETLDNAGVDGGIIWQMIGFIKKSIARAILVICAHAKASTSDNLCIQSGVEVNIIA
jgi:hypothetical protein